MSVKVKTYIPHRGSTCRRALLILDEHGAQYSADLAEMLGINLEDIHSRLSNAFVAGVIDHERRKRNGKTHSLWFLTGTAEETLRLIRPEVTA